MLIETKLRVPAVATGLLDRPSLMAALAQVEKQKLALVEAPTGFGKTTLLAQWAVSLVKRGPAVGWLSAEASDNRIERFLAYIAGAMRRADPDFAPDLPALIGSAPKPPVETVLSVLVNELAARTRDLFLVIDDFHHLDAPDIRAFLQALLGYAPPQFHLVLAARTQGALQMAGLRARGQLVRLDQGNLRFSLAETTQLLNSGRQLGLAPAELALLQHRTEGWPAGLNLAALSLQLSGERADFLGRISGRDDAIADFLVHEVLDRQPPELLDFLLTTSVLERFSAPLAAALSGRADAAAMIAQAERDNLFLSALDADKTWFRYHTLFADLLRGELARRAPERKVGLHLVAARWLAEAGLTSEAVEHALAAGERGLAAELVEACCMPLIRSRSIAHVRDWLTRLPAEVIAERPRLMLAQVWIHFHTSQPGAGARVLGQARRAIAAQQRAGLLGAAEVAELGAEIRVLNAGVLSAADHSRLAIRMGEHCLPDLPRHLHFLRGVLQNVMAFSHYSLGNLLAARRAALIGIDSHAAAPSPFGLIYSELILGLVEKAAGDLDAALAHFARATRLARSSDGARSYSEAMVGIFEAEILYERNDLAGAEALMSLHRPLIEECGLVVHDMACKLLVARLAAARGQAEAALAELEAAERLGLKNRYRRLFSSALQERVKLLIGRGEVHFARLILSARGIDEAWLTDARAQRPASELEHVALARVLIAEGRPQAAQRLLDRLGEAMRRDGRLRRLTQVRALTAIAAYQARDALAALAAIAEAVGLAAPRGALRTLLEEGPALRQVLAFGLERIPAWRKPDSPARRFVGELLDSGAASDTVANEHPQSRPRGHDLHLSPRESEIARLLGQGLGNREIGQALTMAPDTVKWHLKNIFGKLGVTNRTQAVLKLQGIGLAALAAT